MSQDTSPGTHWGRSRWVVSIALVAATQLFLAWKYSTPSKLPPNPRDQETVLQLVGRKPANDELGELAVLSDPTLIGRASERGFSGAGWMRTEPLRHEVHAWHDSPTFLELDVSRLGQEFLAYARTNLPSRITVATNIPVEIARLPLVNDLVPNQSTLRIESGFEGMKLLSSVALPVLHETEMLSSSLVQVLVDEFGQVLTTTLASGSGSKKADDLALNAARSLRFKPYGTPQLGETTWGTVRFDWVAQP